MAKKKSSKWTIFWDMNSGGGQKLDWDKIYIEGPSDSARKIFQALFDRDPDNVTCDCCGNDYSIDEYDSLEQASAYHRKCMFDKKANKWIEKPDTSYGQSPSAYKTLKEYIKQDDVKVVYLKDLKAEDFYG